MQKITLPLNQSLPFASNIPLAELERERILCNNVVFPWEFNPHNCGLWVIGNEFGPVCAVWADCEQDVLDEAVDANLLDGFAVEEKDVETDENGDEIDVTRLGNASEPFDLTNAWMARVKLGELPKELLCLFAEARGNCSKTLYF